MPTVVHSHAARDVDASKVRVALGTRAYDVLIGPNLLDQTGRLIATRIGKGKCGIVTDVNVAEHHLLRVEAALKSEARHKGTVVLPAGEASKSFSNLAPLCEQLLEMGLERGDYVVALGGGVIGDLAGFAASILRRGVQLVQIPTSLLAQVDSSVGGKTGINTKQGKNLIGTFHQPSLVIADIDVLRTLDERQLRAGYAEVAKYGLLGDKDFFSWLEKNWQAVFNGEREAVVQAIETSVTAKADVVVRDEHEAGDRALLNLGHTFGHALEAVTGYSDRLLHGEGVAIGMCLAMEFSERLGHAPTGTAARTAKHLKGVGLPTRIQDIAGIEGVTANELVTIMGQDKKVRDGDLVFILARDIGEAFVEPGVSRQVVRDFLTGCLS